ncbi:MAG: Rho termination factor N-terminal domain-containing protein, partial [Peptococcaceae bacterium]|nr:Rho termination factor N-terminal domain-containing protein [Peptococcaceae bacterium]
MKLEELERIWDLPPGELAAMMKTILGENASPEEMEAALMDIMGNIETMMQRSYTLEECLSFPTKEDLVELAKALKLKGYSKMRKEELQHFLYSYLTKPDYMYRIYPALSNGEVELLNQLSASNIPLISTDMMFCVSGLIQNGLCYLDEYG